MKTKCCVNGCFTVKPVSEFGKNPRSPDGYATRCRSCERDRLLLYKHGMTHAEKNAIAERQGGCLTCGTPEPGRKGWVIDHDRRCCPGDRSCVRCRRGVLCHWCNSALGYAKDDPAILRRLADYLEGSVTPARLDRVALPGRSDRLTRTDGHGRTDVEAPSADLTGANRTARRAYTAPPTSTTGTR